MYWISPEVQEQLPGGLCTVSLIFLLCCQVLGRDAAPALVVTSALHTRRGSMRSGSIAVMLIHGEFAPWGTALVRFFNSYLHFLSPSFHKENISRL